MRFFFKLKFFLTKPIVVVIIGRENKEVKATISRVLGRFLEINKDVFVFRAKEQEIAKFIFFLKNSRLPILLINDIDRVSSIENVPAAKTHFVLNYDDEKVRKIVNFDNPKTLRFGLSQRSDIFVSDIKKNGGTNFKINHKGSLVPFWFKEDLDKKEINIVLSAVSAGIVLGLNLVKISQSFEMSDS